MRSIRNRLLVLQIGALLAVAVVVSAITYRLTFDGFNRVRDFTLEQVAFSILQYGVEPLGSPDEGSFVSQIWNSDGTLRFSSRPEVNLPLQAPGVRRINWENDRWYVFTLRREEATIQVANTERNRAGMFADISRWLLLPLAALLLTLGALLWYAVDRALRPIDAIGREIRAQDPRHLQPIPVSQRPREAVPLVDAINSLLERIDTLLIGQRRFIADAAHELRTPLTAIGLQARIVTMVATTAERDAALDLLLASVERASHLIDKLLQFARFDPEFAPARERVPVAVDELARHLVAELSTQAERRGVDLGLGHCDAAMIVADPEGIRVLLENLLDNAMRYGGRGCRIDVEVHAAADVVAIVVSDDGPGIPDEQKEEAFRRFHRCGRIDETGSGLGLAIVREIAGQNGGSIGLRDRPGGGLVATARFPRCDTHSEHDPT